MKVVDILGSSLDRDRALKFGILTAVAVGGSMIYGAALAASLPHWDLVKGALWLTASSGSGWVVLGSLLCLVTRKPILDLAEACLVTMSVGELVLLFGAGLDWFLIVSRVFSYLDPIFVNAAIVATSNVAMAVCFVTLLSRLGVSGKTSIALWLAGLNGSGALFFWLFYRLIFRGPG